MRALLALFLVCIATVAAEMGTRTANASPVVFRPVYEPSGLWLIGDPTIPLPPQPPQLLPWKPKRRPPSFALNRVLVDVEARTGPSTEFPSVGTIRAGTPVGLIRCGVVSARPQGTLPGKKVRREPWCEVSFKGKSWVPQRATTAGASWRPKPAPSGQ